MDWKPLKYLPQQKFDAWFNGGSQRISEDGS